MMAKVEVGIQDSGIMKKGKVGAEETDDGGRVRERRGVRWISQVFRYYWNVIRRGTEVDPLS
jgi:hypothetical protein